MGLPIAMVPGGGPLYSTLCTRVFTTSNMNVANHPLIPARAPAARRAGHESESLPSSVFLEGFGVKYRSAPSY